MHSFMCYNINIKYRVNSPLNEINKELRMKQWCLYFYSSFSLFSRDKIMQSKLKQIWSYYHLSSEDQNKKNAQLDWHETDNTDHTGCVQQTQVIRWRGGEVGNLVFYTQSTITVIYIYIRVRKRGGESCAEVQTSAIGNWQSCYC